MGRNKLEIKKIENLQSSRVCFSKRRKGLFKKAAALSKLCGIDTTILTFSSVGTPFLSSTIPSSSAVDSIFDQFITDFQRSQISAANPSFNSSSNFQSQISAANPSFNSSSNIQSQISGANPSFDSSSNLEFQLNVENYHHGCSSVNQLLIDVDDLGNLSLTQIQSYKHALEQLKSEVSSILAKKTTSDQGGSSIDQMIQMVITDDNLKTDATDLVCEGGNIEIDQRVFSDDLFDAGTSDQVYKDENETYEGDNETNGQLSTDGIDDEAYNSENEFDLDNFAKDLLNSNTSDQMYVGDNEIDQILISPYTYYQQGIENSGQQFDGILTLWDD